MFDKVMSFLTDIRGNVAYYSPGLFLILLSLLIIFAPMLLVFFIASVLFFIGFTYISMVRRSLRGQGANVRNMREHFRDHASSWYNG